jgi:hypothetical protein
VRESSTAIDFKELQSALLKIPDVQSAKIVGDKVPTEIHIVSSLKRNPKQIVRDVQSLTSAGFNLKIDHRIVSVVQLQEGPATTRESRARPRVERVGLGSQGKSEWVEVTLAWPEGITTGGSGASGRSREARARGATTAVLECLDKRLSSMEATVEIDHILIQQIGSTDWVLVQAIFYQRGEVTPVLGSAHIHDDVATAAARALLNGINRKLTLA